MFEQASRVVVIAAAIGVLVSSAKSVQAGAPGDAKERVVFSDKLLDTPGKRLTAVVVDYPPAGKSAQHRHAGSVFAYVLEGAVRSQNSATGGLKIYNAGDSFFEPAGSQHLVSENASASKPARFLAIFVADDGAKLTTASH